ncbi:hypothetical protein CI109_101723 [Kwoniella shandongensis]|uniref:Uncharacterized protein n=1 Tax=Kwoniella shandongensis TaxID=1734106 RepID=A0A5M6C5R7_9TREE|nr:uncharacterized protein CI109_001154 [Kwoniella shandongensis]KAA5530353.1 hypothetical protein CI109_001154 [Kwoniella shandongensis]
MSTSTFNVLLLGAGPINFGSTEGPWNHSKRLEQKLGSRLNVVGLIDRDLKRAEDVLTIKRADANVQTGYEKTKVFSSIAEAASGLTGDDVPHLAVLGFQPNTRGATIPGHNNEIELVRSFPNIALLVEKPISDLDDFAEVEAVAKELKGTITSVGYMLRYLKAVQEMKKIIDDNKLTVMASITTYLLAYSFASKSFFGYWDKSREPGPIVSQATHVCDLTRYLTPRALLDTVHVKTVEHSEPAGNLSLLEFDEEGLVKPENRISRVTNATWKYENGAVGTLLHGVCLHEGDYDVELLILADGWKLKLVDPYGTAPKLYIRRPGTTEEVMTVFTDDDCYYSEVSNLIDVIDGKADKSIILSSYEDAIESYKLTWAIRHEGERSFAERNASQA